jgi:hypothetical protein
LTRKTSIDIPIIKEMKEYNKKEVVCIILLNVFKSLKKIKFFNNY